MSVFIRCCFLSEPRCSSESRKSRLHFHSTDRLWLIQTDLCTDFAVNGGSEFTKSLFKVYIFWSLQCTGSYIFHIFKMPSCALWEVEHFYAFLCVWLEYIFNQLHYAAQWLSEISCKCSFIIVRAPLFTEVLGSEYANEPYLFLFRSIM